MAVTASPTSAADTQTVATRLKAVNAGGGQETFAQMMLEGGQPTTPKQQLAEAVAGGKAERARDAGGGFLASADEAANQQALGLEQFGRHVVEWAFPDEYNKPYYSTPHGSVSRGAFESTLETAQLKEQTELEKDKNTIADRLGRFVGSAGFSGLVAAPAAGLIAPALPEATGIGSLVASGAATGAVAGGVGALSSPVTHEPSESYGMQKAEQVGKGAAAGAALGGALSGVVGGAIKGFGGFGAEDVPEDGTAQAESAAAKAAREEATKANDRYKATQEANAAKSLADKYSDVVNSQGAVKQAKVEETASAARLQIHISDIENLKSKLNTENTTVQGLSANTYSAELAKGVDRFIDTHADLHGLTAADISAVKKGLYGHLANDVVDETDSKLTPTEKLGAKANSLLGIPTSRYDVTNEFKDAQLPESSLGHAIMKGEAWGNLTDDINTKLATVKGSVNDIKQKMLDAVHARRLAGTPEYAQNSELRGAINNVRMSENDTNDVLPSETAQSAEARVNRHINTTGTLQKQMASMNYQDAVKTLNGKLSDLDKSAPKNFVVNKVAADTDIQGLTDKMSAELDRLGGFGGDSGHAVQGWGKAIVKALKSGTSDIPSALQNAVNHAAATGEFNENDFTGFHELPSNEKGGSQLDTRTFTGTNNIITQLRNFNKVAPKVLLDRENGSTSIALSNLLENKLNGMSGGELEPVYTQRGRLQDFVSKLSKVYHKGRDFDADPFATSNPYRKEIFKQLPSEIKRFKYGFEFNKAARLGVSDSQYVSPNRYSKLLDGIRGLNSEASPLDTRLDNAVRELTGNIRVAAEHGSNSLNNFKDLNISKLGALTRSREAQELSEKVAQTTKKGLEETLTEATNARVKAESRYAMNEKNICKSCSV